VSEIPDIPNLEVVRSKILFLIGEHSLPNLYFAAGCILVDMVAMHIPFVLWIVCTEVFIRLVDQLLCGVNRNHIQYTVIKYLVFHCVASTDSSVRLGSRRSSALRQVYTLAKNRGQYAASHGALVCE